MKNAQLFSAFTLVATVMAAATSVTAQAGDLTLPGEKWLAKFDKFVCSESVQASARPQPFESYNVQFEQVTTDFTLDNVLLKATFDQNGKSCRYNAILFADNAAMTATLLQSIAYDPAGAGSAYADCQEGKALIDQALAKSKYLYYGHPHNLALMLPLTGAADVCGREASLVGVNFVVKGKVAPKPEL